MPKLTNVAHPLSALRDYLISKRPPSNRVMREAAQQKGFDLTERASFFSKFIDSQGETVSCVRTLFSDQGCETEAALANALNEEKIPYFRGAGSDKWLKSFHIASRDTRLVIDLLVNKFSANGKVLVRLNDRTVLTAEHLGRHSRKYRQNRYHLLCVEKEDGAQKVLGCSWIELSIWREIPIYGSERTYETATANPNVRRLRRSTLETYLSEHTDIDQLDDHLNSVPKFPIDVVYTWVDDKDIAWQKSRAEYSGKDLIANSGRSNLDERFTNRDELRYSLRSIDLFAPFVRTIYLVTCGHTPSWLNTDNPRIKVVKHADIFSDPSVLPTFNSSGIETQLHHIDGLAENFLYFNDDFFLGDFCTPEDFFHSNGVIKYFTGEQKSFEHDIDSSSEEYISADKNAIELIKAHTGSYTRELMLHAPYPASRSLLYELENTFRDSFQACAGNRFRAHSDLRPIAFMQYHYGYQKMKTAKDTISNRYLALWKPSIDQAFKSMLVNRNYKTFCINDVGIPASRLNWTNIQVRKFLESYFPFKSSFEK